MTALESSRGAPEYESADCYADRAGVVSPQMCWWIWVARSETVTVRAVFASISR
jgi:hypothetical protein